MFTAFEGQSRESVDAFLSDFYDREIEAQGRFAQADEVMNRLREEGVEVLIVSATFGPIVRRALDFHPIDGCLCTEMRVDAQGRYTTRVEGRA